VIFDIYAVSHITKKVVAGPRRATRC
jgi:hypothetical protein